MGTNDSESRNKSFLERGFARLKRAGFDPNRASDKSLAIGDANTRMASQFLVRSEVEEQAGRRDSALELIEAAIEAAPQLSYAWARRAQVQQALDHPEEALVSYDRALTLDPSDGATWFNKATIYINKYGLIGTGVLEAGMRGQIDKETLDAFDQALACLKRAEQLGYSKAAPVIEVLAGFRQIVTAAKDKHS
jgi:tetratricopeptide (TPR) repeat protein